MTQTGSDKSAIAWILANNVKEEESFSEMKDIYRKGVRDGKNRNDSIVEDYTEDVTTDGLDIAVDENGETEGGFLGNMEKGLKFWVGRTTYDGIEDDYWVEISVDYSVTTSSALYPYSAGVLRWTLYRSGSTAEVCAIYTTSSSSWLVKRLSSSTNKTDYVCEWIIKPKNNYLYGNFKVSLQNGNYVYYNLDWTSVYSDEEHPTDLNVRIKVIQMWQKSTTISTIT